MIERIERIEETGRYSTVAIAFHWVIAALVIVNLAVGALHDSVPALRAWMPGHKSIGITVLALTLARVAWRLLHRPPRMPAYVAGWQRGAAHAVHWTLYLLLLAMPLTGWMLVSGSRRGSLNWFGLFDIPYLPITPGAAGAGHSAHGVLGWLMLALVAVHVAAALRHHFVLRDNVLARMAPALARR